MFRLNKISHKRGLTFLEIVIALSLFTVALLGFMQIFNTALDSSYRAAQEIIATNLGRSLMAEIMAKNFAEPDIPNASLGSDGSESRFGGGNNSFDDVDDYDGYSDSPPVSVGNVVLNGAGGAPDYSAFSRSVSVLYLDLDTNQTSQTNPYNYKRIVVTTSGPYVSNIVMYGIKTNLTIN